MRVAQFWPSGAAAEIRVKNDVPVALMTRTQRVSERPAKLRFDRTAESVESQPKAGAIEQARSNLLANAGEHATRSIRDGRDAVGARKRGELGPADDLIHRREVHEKAPTSPRVKATPDYATNRRHRPRIAPLQRMKIREQVLDIL